MTETLKVPTIHLNGTGYETLVREYQTAIDAVHAAREILGNVTVHGRDYYVQADPDAYVTARDQHLAHIDALAKIEADLTEVLLGILEQERK